MISPDLITFAFCLFVRKKSPSGKQALVFMTRSFKSFYSLLSSNVIIDQSQCLISQVSTTTKIIFGVNHRLYLPLGRVNAGASIAQAYIILFTRPLHVPPISLHSLLIKLQVQQKWIYWKGWGIGCTPPLLFKKNYKKQDIQYLMQLY